jgi:ankyrin repeat protein
MTFLELWRSIDESNGVVELKQYLDAGGDVNVHHPDAVWSLLHLAVEHMNYPLIEALVNSGADVNDRGTVEGSGWTPLHVAVDIDIDSVLQEHNSFEKVTFSTVHLLLSLGADPTVRASDGRTPRDIVARYSEDLLSRFDTLISS